MAPTPIISGPIKPYLKLPSFLGESPYYHEEDEILYALDLEKQRIFSIKTNQNPPVYESTELSTYASTIAKIKGMPDKLLVATKNGFAKMDMCGGDDGEMTWKSHTRMGPERSSLTGGGIFWRIDPDLSIHAMLYDLQVPNGMGWSPDNKIMFFADSLAQTIYAFDFDASTGNISRQRLFYKFSGFTLPDGLAVDEIGGIWVAAWRGFAVLHISSTDVLLEDIMSHTACVACPAFGGVGGREIVVTTARTDLAAVLDGMTEMRQTAKRGRYIDCM